MRNALQLVRLKQPLKKSFATDHSLEFETESFVVKTAQKRIEVAALLKFRHDIYHREFGVQAKPFGYDIDEFDFLCDHIFVQEKETKKMVATYRLLKSSSTKKFYSGSEFDLSSLSEIKGEKLELGRACVHPEFRTGIVFQLIWRGIVEYMKLSQTRYLIGCSSVKTENPYLAERFKKYFLEENYALDDFKISPLKKYQFKDQDFEKHTSTQASVENYSTAQIQQALPPLLQFYLKAGSKVCVEPAYDREFYCLDYFTILDLENLHPVFARKYGLKSKIRKKE